MAAATLLATACQAAVVSTPPAENADVAFTTALPSYRAGAEVELRLANNTSGDLGYNLCLSQLQRHEGGSWTAAPSADRICTMELRLLQPGGVASYHVPLPRSLPAGQYRFTTTVEHMGSGEGSAVVSNAFAVTQ